MRFSQKILLVLLLFILPLGVLWVATGSISDTVAFPFLFNKSYPIESWAEDIAVQPAPASPKPIITQVEVQAEDKTRLDRSQPEWLREYCFSRIKELATMPTSFERSRGPTFNFPPVYQPERHLVADNSATCNLDFYIHPVNKEAFADLGIEYQYSKPVWQEFQHSVAASVSAQLVNEDWRVVSMEEVDGEDIEEKQSIAEPTLSLSYTNRSENLKEYLDVFFTNDEEVVFELLVVQP